MATALSTALMLSGLPDEEVKDVLTTNFNYFDEKGLYNWGPSNSLYSEFPKNKGEETSLQTIDKVDNAEKSSTNDNYYLEVVESLEKNILGAVSPPPASVVSDDGYRTCSTDQSDTETRNVPRTISSSGSDNAEGTELVSGLLSFVQKTEHYPEITAAKLIFHCDLINLAEKRYEKFVQQQSKQQNQAPNDNEHKKNKGYNNQNQPEGERQEQDQTLNLEQTLIEEQIEDQEQTLIQEQNNGSGVANQNRYLAWLNDFEPYRYEPFLFSSVTHHNISAISRLNGVEIPRQVILQCLIDGCNFMEPFFT